MCSCHRLVFSQCCISCSDVSAYDRRYSIGSLLHAELFGPVFPLLPWRDSTVQTPWISTDLPTLKNEDTCTRLSSLDDLGLSGAHLSSVDHMRLHTSEMYKQGTPGAAYTFPIDAMFIHTGLERTMLSETDLHTLKGAVLHALDHKAAAWTLPTILERQNDAELILECVMLYMSINEVQPQYSTEPV